ncbi:phage tail spike protein [Mesobacillus subterraneus]|uniref:phage tail spike protein n=1 Tax=Mesobacillus subterraneus TaxID=285983 RepID=UPI00273E4E47|nr:phage tail spike protein [Mesobacillus subterraneus]WLR54829.1 phage tail spike protein [Mesobacillus subterraneus]
MEATVSMIHILHHQKDEIINWINHVKSDNHENSIENDEKYNFIVSVDESGAADVGSRSRILIPGEEGDYREFIVDYTFERTAYMEKEVYTKGSFIDIRKSKIISPQVLDGQTIQTAGGMVLSGLEWEVGIVEYSGIRKWVIEKHLDAYEALKAIAELFDCELRFRVTVDGDQITGRYVDFIKKQGLNRGKETVFGKDLIGIIRKVYSDRIVTALHCLGPERQDGTRLEVVVTDDAAFQNWNRKGKHLIELYEPESTDQDMTLERLTQLGEIELKKRIAAAIEYEVEAASLEHIFGYEHEITRLGDSVKIKDEHFNPPMYLDSRVIFVDRSVFNKAKKSYKLGEVIEYKKEDVMKTWRELQALYATKVIKSPTAPPGKPNIIWIKTGGTVEIAHTWDAELNEWVPTGGSLYNWVMYSDDASGNGISSSPAGKEYIGFAYNKEEETPSLNPGEYAWSKLQGDQGVPGPPGDDGQTPYFHTAWADSADGTVNFSTTTAGTRAYIGTYSDFTSADSTSPAKYKWAKIQGSKGNDGYTPVKGVDYFDGKDGQNGVSSYLHIRYSQSADGSSMTTDPSGAKYIGVATTSTSAAPTANTSYRWSLIKGDQGLPGETGSDGKTSYLHIKYSNDGGATFTANNGETVGAWIGTYVDFIQADSMSVSAYTWNKVKGEKGDTGSQGVPGPAGKDGQSLYTWVKYADTSTGGGISDSPTGKKYMGIAVNKTSSTESTNAADYTWAKIEGDQGIPGPAGSDGVTTYTWVKYADDNLGNGMSDSPDGKRYLGLAYNKTTASESTNKADYSWSPLYDNVKVGGRNLLLNSAQLVQNAKYDIAQYTLSESVANGDKVTFTLKGQLAATKSSFRLYNSGGSVPLATLQSIGGGLYQATFDWVVGSSANREVWIYTFLSTQSGTSTIEWVKLEKGNVATDWTPAPEDVDKAISDVDTKATNAQTAANNAKSTADGKNTLFRQSTQPSTSGRKVGDLWFDTANGNRMYVWTGSWTLTKLDYQALAVGKLSAISADLGDVTTGNLSGVRIVVSDDIYNTVTIDNGIVESKYYTPAGEQRKSTLKDGYINFDYQSDYVAPRSGSVGIEIGGSMGIRGVSPVEVKSTGSFVEVKSDTDEVKINGKTVVGLYNNGFKRAEVFNNGIRLIGDNFLSTADRTWIAPTLLNGVTNMGGGYRTAGYYKDAQGLVRIRAFLQGVADGKHLFTLPAGFRPSEMETFICWTNNSVGSGRITIYPDGRVVATISGNWLALSPPPFMAEI